MAPIPPDAYTVVARQLHSTSIFNTATTALRTLKCALPSFNSVIRSSMPSLPPSSFTPRSNTASTPAMIRRQAIAVIPAGYANLNSGPKPGTVVGIVLGSVGGLLLVLWLIYTCMNLGNIGNNNLVEEEVVVRQRTRSRSRPRSHRTTVMEEVVEERRSRTPPRPRRESVRETIVVEETRRPPSDRSDDIVEVIEEHSPAPRRSKSGRQSGYRNVDPESYGGGSRPLRPVRR
ncbi:hypothetical protein MMC25_004274 [Agyrium rufum]|nr:hypothetical protein [Agyrium rufum]